MSRGGEHLLADRNALGRWFRTRPGPPQVTRTYVPRCPEPHEAAWSYVEVDGAGTTVRRRCVACGLASAVLGEPDAAALRMWSCGTCYGSIGEVGVGAAAEQPGAGDHPGQVTHIEVAARCMGCGGIDRIAATPVCPVPMEQLAAYYGV